MSFLKAVAIPSDARTKEVLTLTGQKLGWIKNEHDEWAFVANSSSARLSSDLLKEVITLLENM